MMQSRLHLSSCMYTELDRLPMCSAQMPSSTPKAVTHEGELKRLGVHIRSLPHKIWIPGPNSLFYARTRQMGRPHKRPHHTQMPCLDQRRQPHYWRFWIQISQSGLTVVGNRGIKSKLHLADSWASDGWFRWEEAFIFCQGNICGGCWFRRISWRGIIQQVLQASCLSYGS